jgi:dTDP-glucose 4,6-dehydratase
MKHILVTGGAGFIGSNFIHYLLEKVQGIHIINLDALTYAGNPANFADLADDPRHEFIHGNICDRGLVSQVLRGIACGSFHLSPASVH